MSARGDTRDTAREVQIAALRRMGGPARLLAACRMSDEAVRLSEAGIRHRHPDWSDARVRRELRVLMLGRELAARVERQRGS